MATITWNSRGQLILNGQARILRGFYDAGFAGSGGTDMAGHVTARDYARYKTNFVNLVTSGTVGNGLRLADALVSHTPPMYCLAVGNFFGTFVFDPASFNPAASSFDIQNNSTYTTSPEGTGGFQTLFPLKAGSLGIYSADEPTTGHAQNWGLQDTIVHFDYYRSVTPTMPIFVVYLNDNIYQWLTWSPLHIADLLGNDIYTIGQAPETDPGNGGTLGINTYGYMNFSVGEAAALARYYCRLYAPDGSPASGTNRRVPHIVLQLNKFGTASRFPTQSEYIGHFAAAMTELQGEGGFIWWAMGTQNGALDQQQTCTFNGNGTRTVFSTLTPDSGTTSRLYAEEAVDVVVRVSGVIQVGNYTLQNLGDFTLVRSGNFWLFANPLQVTFNPGSAPPSGTGNVTVTVNRWPATKKATALQFLEDACDLIDTHESLMLDNPSETLVVNNSTWMTDALTWRRSHVLTLSNGASNRPVWIFAGLQRYQDENTRLNLATPDLSLSNHMLDQRGNVRTCAWEGAEYALLSAYNMNPEAQNGVQITLSRAFSRAEVLLESRDAPLTNNGTVLTDTFGGASSLRQGSFNQGHIYKLHYETSPNDRPSFVGAGTVTSGTGATVYPLPSGLITDHGLLLLVRSNGAAPAITDINGGSWTTIGTQATGGVVRLTAYWSRYNGTQGNPTVGVSGTHQHGVILAFRNCVSSGSLINAVNGDGSNFATTSATIPSVTTTFRNCLILDVVALAGPDANGTDIFSAWVNSNLTQGVERIDSSVDTDTGGSLGVYEHLWINTGGTGTSTVAFTGNNYHNVRMKIALQPLEQRRAPVGMRAGVRVHGRAGRAFYGR